MIARACSPRTSGHIFFHVALWICIVIIVKGKNSNKWPAQDLSISTFLFSRCKLKENKNSPSRALKTRARRRSLIWARYLKLNLAQHSLKYIPVVSFSMFCCYCLHNFIKISLNINIHCCRHLKYEALLKITPQHPKYIFLRCKKASDSIPT